jgi:ABC-type sugar transport system ATPase subunit
MPALLLLDEPLARLDATLSQRMRLELRSLQQGYGVTTFLATNDPVEAMALPDRLVMVDAGRVVQVAEPIDVYERPVNLAAAACTGQMSTVTMQVEADDEGFWLVHPSFRHRAWRPSLINYVGGAVVMAMRPRWMSLTDDGPIQATITEARPGAGSITVALGADTGSGEVTIATTAPAHRRGDHVALRIDELALFDPLTGYHLP